MQDIQQDVIRVFSFRGQLLRMTLNFNINVTRVPTVLSTSLGKTFLLGVLFQMKIFCSD